MITPDVSPAGAEAARAAWLLAQHSICTPGLQRRFRDCLEEAVSRNDAPKRQPAWLD